MTVVSSNCRDCIYISTHTPLAGRDYFPLAVWTDGLISTHTPLAGRDEDGQSIIKDLDISTHTPLAGRDAITAC